MSKLTSAQRQQITSFFLNHPLRPCQVCGSPAGYHMMDMGTMPDHPMQTAFVPTYLRGTPVVLMHCVNCQNVLMFYAKGMGVT